MAKIITSFCFFLFALSVNAQFMPITWDYQVEKINETEFDLVFTAELDPGWYIYSQNLESDDGPIKTSFTFTENSAYQLVGETKESGDKTEGFDSLFEMNVIKYSGTTKFTQRIKLTDSISDISGYFEFMTCDKNRCLPPQEIEFSFKL